jgi:hypothetical protein
MRESSTVFPVLQPERKSKKKSADKIPLYQIQRDLISWMSGGFVPILNNEKPFDDCYYCFYRDPIRGVRELVSVEHRLAKPISVNALFNELWRRMGGFSGKASQYQLEVEKVEKIAEAYLKVNHSKFLQQPPAIFCFEDEEKIAFNRIKSPAPISEFFPSSSFREKAPIYSDFLDRNSESLAVRQFLGSMLFVDSPRKKSLFLYGHPDGGKTTMISMLLSGIFGANGFAIYDPARFDDPFWKADLIGKLALFVDESNAGLIRSNKYKQLTGGDIHRINPKGQPAFDAHICCKIIHCSNPEPEFDRDDSTRVIVSHVANLKQKMSPTILAQALKNEFPFIIADILQAYSELAGREIEFSTSGFDDAVGNFELPFETIFEELFEVAPNDKSLPITEFTRLISEKPNKPYGVDAKSMRRYVIQKYGCDPRAVGWDMLSRKHFKAISGIRKKSSQIW